MKHIYNAAGGQRLFLFNMTFDSQHQLTFIRCALVVRLEVPLGARAGVLVEGERLLADGARLPSVAGARHVHHRRLQVAVH